ncbi:MAG: lipid-A-disaccharide synthase [Candidatus Omnitrophica bacterium]|nr:lipid-A-disaccharide synthase [Candidatus Omnitrophota bacterium]
MKKIVFVAGDKSGDVYAGLLSQELKEQFKNNIAIYSFGGESLAQHSQQLLDLVKHSVSGIFEVARHFREILNVFRFILDRIRQLKPDLVILVDFPDFNLRLAKELHGKFPLFYYISPQVWAWRKKRVHDIKKFVEKIIVLFEFEERLYRQAGVDVCYFGHPLLEIIARGLPSDPPQSTPDNTILLMPGSRKNEIARHLPVMLSAKKIIEKQLPDYRFKIVRPENIPEHFYLSMMPCSLPMIRHSYQDMAGARFIITSSGTATLEIAILGTPFLIIYKVNLATWVILKNIVHIDFIGMPNIIAGKEIAKELVQFQATPTQIASFTLKMLRDENAYLNIKHELQAIKDRLRPQSALTNTAGFLGKYLGLKQSHTSHDTRHT